MALMELQLCKIQPKAGTLQAWRRGSGQDRIFGCGSMTPGRLTSHSFAVGIEPQFSKKFYINQTNIRSCFKNQSFPLFFRI